MKNIFLIKTPLQLLNAIEAKHYFNLDAEECVLIIMGDRKSQPQILMLASATDEWGTVVSINEVNLFFGDPFERLNDSVLNKFQHLNVFKKSLFYVRRLNRLSKFLKEVDHIFVGYTNYIYMTHFINATPHRRLIFLDDGNGTLELSEKRKYGENASTPIPLLKKIKRYAKMFLQRVKWKEKGGACFFTVYDISPASNDEVIKHDFKYLRSSVNSLPTTDEVYFIGSPLSEVGIMSEESYFSNLKNVDVYFKEQSLIYIAHRRDTPEKLAKIENELGLKVVLFKYPIEYQLACIGPRPKVLASFFSAALDSCRLIFGNDLKIIAFKLDMSDSPKRYKIESIYASYEPLVSDTFIIESDF